MKAPLLTSFLPRSSTVSACADFDLHLAKTVQLGVDGNANGFGVAWAMALLDGLKG